jgi:sucrose-6-phosphate hydrolase SacC (GH32 family)
MQQHRRLICLFATVAIFSHIVARAQAETHYLFTYFTGNGEDGLHLAHSTDGMTWTALNEGKSLLTPTAGGDKLMRDPSIVRGPDGRFHMVWTVSWGEKGIGYTSSADLIHWDEQQYIPVMEHEPITGDYWAEGPTYLNIDGKWHVYSDKYTDHQYGVVTSTDLETWTDESDSLTMPSGMRHGTAFEAPEEIVAPLLELGE